MPDFSWKTVGAVPANKNRSANDIGHPLPLLLLTETKQIFLTIKLVSSDIQWQQRENENGYSLPCCSHQNRNMNKLAPTTTRNSPGQPFLMSSSASAKLIINSLSFESKKFLAKLNHSKKIISFCYHSYYLQTKYFLRVFSFFLSKKDPW